MKQEIARAQALRQEGAWYVWEGIERRPDHWQGGGSGFQVGDSTEEEGGAWCEPGGALMGFTRGGWLDPHALKVGPRMQWEEEQEWKLGDHCNTPGSKWTSLDRFKDV